MIQQSIDLKDLNSWKVGGRAEHFCQPGNVDEVRQALEWAKENKVKVTPLGGGTNVLVSDQGISGLVLHTKKLKGVAEVLTTDRLELTVLAGTPKFELMRAFMKHRLSPALFLSGLPGDVGGGVVMNAGVREKREPREFCEIVDWFEVIPFDRPDQVVRYSKDQVQWVYRKSTGWDPGVIVRVGCSWPMQPIPTLPKEIKAANELRKSKQPLEWPSCGSTFKNPSPELSAGQLIDQCGLKGFQVGDAQVSPKHANFLINLGQATATDISNLIQHIQERVKSEKGVELQTEVRRLGEW